MPHLHADLEPIAYLLGTWRGAGAGSYPTIDDFTYTEEVTFGHVGKPFLAYGQKTRHAVTELPLHAEAGYWRPTAEGDVEVVLAHPTGILELLVGSHEVTAEGGVLDLASSSIMCTPTAKTVSEVRRRFEVSGDELRYELSMAAVGVPLTHHLAATLQRSPTA